MIWAIICLVLLAFGLLLLVAGEERSGYIIIFSALGTAVVMTGLSWFQHKRSRQMAAIAEQLGFTFVPIIYQPTLTTFVPFRLLTDAGAIVDAMQGQVGDRNVLVFDYQYTTVKGLKVDVFYQTAVIIFDAAIGVPNFELAPKAVFDKEGGRFAPRSIVLEDAPEFSRCCALTGSDAAALRPIFHPELVRCLTKDGRWFIEALDGQLLLYRSPKVDAQRRPGLLADALEIGSLIRKNTGAPTR